MIITIIVVVMVVIIIIIRENEKGGMRKGGIGKSSLFVFVCCVFLFTCPIPPFLIPHFPFSRIIRPGRRGRPRRARRGAGGGWPLCLRAYYGIVC